MSVLPELVLRASLVRGLDAFRSDGTYARELFSSMTGDDQERCVRYCETLALPIHAGGMPKPNQLTLPCAVIILRNESEPHPMLGDFMGYEPPEDHAYGGAILPDVIGGTASAAGAAETQQAWPEDGSVYSVASAASNMLSIADATLWWTKRWATGSYEVHIEGGTGRGQVRQITDNTPSSLIVSPSWVTIPDTTSRFSIHRIAAEEPARIGTAQALYDKRSSQIVERIGSILKPTYNVIVAESEPWRLLVLTAILKAVILSARLLFERNGMHGLKVTATDVVSAQALLPAEAYARSMLVEFHNEFSLTRIADGIIGDGAVTSIGLELYDGQQNQVTNPATVTIDTGVEPPGVLP
jgi:hypothetical protein